MKAVDQRIAIAQLLGIKVAPYREFKELPIGCKIEGKIYYNLPYYESDLNAVMEPCKLLAKKGWRCVANMGLDGTWECFFTQSRDFNVIPQGNDHFGAGETLAEALAEAFLRCCGKWTDADPKAREGG